MILEESKEYIKKLFECKDIVSLRKVKNSLFYKELYPKYRDMIIKEFLYLPSFSKKKQTK